MYIYILYYIYVSIIWIILNSQFNPFLVVQSYLYNPILNCSYTLIYPFVTSSAPLLGFFVSQVSASRLCGGAHVVHGATATETPVPRIQWTSQGSTWKIAGKGGKMARTYMYIWINSYFHTILSGMNIHESQLFWCEQKGYYWFWHTAICIYIYIHWGIYKHSYNHIL